MAAKRWVNTRMFPKKAGDKVKKREKKPLLKTHSDPWDVGKWGRVLGNPGE